MLEIKLLYSILRDTASRCVTGEPSTYLSCCDAHKRGRTIDRARRCRKHILDERGLSSEDSAVSNPAAERVPYLESDLRIRLAIGPLQEFGA